MPRWVLILAGVFFSLVAVVSLGVALIPRFVNVNYFRLPLENGISNALRRKVTLGKLQLKTLGGIWLQAEQVRIFDPGGRTQESQARQVEVEVELWPLLSRQLVIKRVQLVGLVLSLKRDRAGRWNFENFAISPSTVKTDTGYRGPAVSLSESTIQVSDLSKPTLQPLTVQKVRLDLEPEDPYHLQVNFLGELPSQSSVQLDGNLVLPEAGSRDAWGGKLHILTKRLAAESVAGYLGGALQGLKGLLDLDLQLQLAREPVLAGTIRAQSLDWNWPEVWGKTAWKTTELKLDADITFKLQQLLVQRLTLDLPGLQAELQGTLPRFFNKPGTLDVALQTKPFDPFKVRQSLPVGVLPPAVRAWLARSTGEGQASTKLKIQGSTGQPVIAGQVDLSGLSVRDPAFPRPLEKLQGQVTFDPNRVVFTDLRGNLAQSPFTLAGTISDYRTVPRPRLTFNCAAFDLAVFRWIQTAGLLGPSSTTLSSLAGTARVELQILEKQTLGLVDFQGARVGIVGLDKPFEDVRGTVLLEAGKTSFQQLKGRLADSPLSVDGSLSSTGNLQLRGQGVLSPQLLASVGSALQVNGAAPLQFSATGSTRKLDFRGQLDLGKLQSLKLNDLNLLPAQSLVMQGTYTPGQIILTSTRLALGAVTFEGGGAVRKLGTTAPQLDLQVRSTRPLTIQLVRNLFPEIAALGVTDGSTGLALAIKGSTRAPGFQALLNLQNVTIADWLGGISKLTGPLTITRDQASTTGLSFQTPDGKGQAKGTLNNFASPRLTFESSFARLNLDRVLTKAPTRPAANSNAGRSVQGQGRLAVDQGVIARLPFQKLQATVAFNQSQVSLSNLTFNAAQGRVSANLKTDSKTRSTQGNLALRNADANTLATQLLKFPNGQLFGRTDMDLNFQSQGNEGDAFLKSLDGRGSLTIRDGRLASLNLLGPILRVAQDVGPGSGFNLNTLLGAVGRLNTGRFQQLGGRFVIDNGVASTDDFKYLGPSLRMQMSGNLGLVTRVADLQVEGEFTNNLSGSTGGLIGGILGRLLNVPRAQPQAFSFAVRGPVNQLSSLRSVRY